MPPAEFSGPGTQKPPFLDSSIFSLALPLIGYINCGLGICLATCVIKIWLTGPNRNLTTVVVSDEDGECNEVMDNEDDTYDRMKYEQEYYDASQRSMIEAVKKERENKKSCQRREEKKLNDSDEDEGTEFAEPVEKM